MKFGIFYEGGGQRQLLCRKDGTEMWFSSMQEVMDFLREYEIPILDGTVVHEIIGTFIVSSYHSAELRDMLDNGIPEKVSDPYGLRAKAAKEIAMNG